MSIIEKVIQFVYRRRCRNHLATVSRERRFVNYDKARSVLILFESDYTEKNPNIRRLISNLQQDGKKVSAWGFIDKQEVMSSILPDFRILHHKQMDFFHTPLESYLNELDTMEFDLLLDLTVRPILTLQYFALYARATFKAGAHRNEVPVYDFLMDISQVNKDGGDEYSQVVELNEIYLYDQIIFYLKSIQTND